MNKYLEKVALNAAKLRGIAKQVGIIPVAESAWKSAVRRLRDGRGAALEGKALAKAKTKLGDISNNAYQKIVSQNRTHGANGTELTGHIDRHGKLTNKLTLGSKGAVDRAELKRVSDNLHTHPITQSDSVLLRNKNKELSRLATGPLQASPSGGKEYHEFVNKLTPKHFEKSIEELGKAQEARDDLKKATALHKKLLSSGKLSHDEKNEFRRDLMESKAYTKFEVKRHTERARLLTPSDIRQSRGDMFVLLGKANYAGEASERIVAPQSHVVSHTRMVSNSQSPMKARTIYFDHTPRKTKT